MKKYKYTTDLISRLIKWEFVECGNSTFKTELEKVAVSNNVTLSIIKTEKELDSCKNGYILLCSKKPIIFGTMKVDDYYINKVSNCTLPTPHTYLLEKIEISK